MLEKHLVVITPREGAEVGEWLLLGWTVRVLMETRICLGSP